MGICAKKSKKVRKYKSFFKKAVENYVDNVDKKRDSFPQKSVEKENPREIPLFGNLWR